MSGVTRKRLLRQKGRQGGDIKLFAHLPDEVLRSDAYRTLPHPVRSVLVALTAQFRGHNNGSLTFTRATAVQYGIGNTHVLQAALAELDERGLIIQTRPGTRKPPVAAAYAITWRPVDEPTDVKHPHHATASLTASDAWRKWKSSKTQPHWITTKRRAVRWRVATRTGGAWPQGNDQMSGAWAPNKAVFSVARGHSSYIADGDDAECVEPRLEAAT